MYLNKHTNETICLIFNNGKIEILTIILALKLESHNTNDFNYTLRYFRYTGISNQVN